MRVLFFYFPVIIISLLIGVASHAQAVDIERINSELERLRNSTNLAKQKIIELERRIDSLESSSSYADEYIRINDSLIQENLRLDRYNKKWEKQIDTLIDVTDSSNSSVSNILAAVGIAFVVFSILLGIYINRKEKKIGELLDESRKVLIEQQRIEDLTNNRINELYRVIRQEELREIFSEIDRNPPSLEFHFYNLLSFSLQYEQYNQLGNWATNWGEDIQNRGFLSEVSTLILFHFPEAVAGNPNLLEKIIGHFNHGFNYLNEEKFKKLLNGVLQGFLIKKDPRYADALNSIFRVIGIAKPHYTAELLFELVDEKTKRFELYKFLTPNIQKYQGMVLKYCNLLINEYNYTDKSRNTDEQNKIIKEITDNKLLKKK